MAQFTVDISENLNDMRSLVRGKRSLGDESMLSGFRQVGTVSGYVDVTGIQNVLDNWSRVSGALRDAAREQMLDAAALIEIQSQIEVPYDKGPLQAAMRRDEEELGASHDGSGPIRIYIYYDVNAVVGDNGESYAWIQHENRDYVHKTPGTKAKYLEDPFLEVSAMFPEMCQGALTSVVSNAPRLVKRSKV